MPVFEYRCGSCGARYSVLAGVVAEPGDATCPKCGGAGGEKLVSRFSRYRGEDARIDEAADQMEAIGEPDSPTQVRELMREMGKAMDEDVSDEMEEMFEADVDEA